MPVTPHDFDRLAKSMPGMGRDPASVRRRIEAMEHMLERLIQLPFLKRKIGLDVLLDILPVGGPVIASAMGAWLVWEARNVGAPKYLMARMAGNVAIDAVLSAIPFLGAIPDYFFRSNSRNVRLLRKYLDRYHPGSAIIDA